ncbi:hypothetical protein NA57DRAFT_54750 [Rhizodiscina lignyota]|uniref:Uncharacterized protein n=1 Tax=Rhizodiscina lignyota TaxID=1504668 RepID=A0A9P4MCH9_9PEZI|nr:hypothetical protein NA57DRAFT_54750 [Rhizodiscina lignyota]
MDEQTNAALARSGPRARGIRADCQRVAEGIQGLLLRVLLDATRADGCAGVVLEWADITAVQRRRRAWEERYVGDPCPASGPRATGRWQNSTLGQRPVPRAAAAPQGSVGGLGERRVKQGWTDWTREDFSHAAARPYSNQPGGARTRSAPLPIPCAEFCTTRAGPRARQGEPGAEAGSVSSRPQASRPRRAAPDDLSRSFRPRAVSYGARNDSCKRVFVHAPVERHSPREHRCGERRLRRPLGHRGSSNQSLRPTNLLLCPTPPASCPPRVVYVISLAALAREAADRAIAVTEKRDQPYGRVGLYPQIGIVAPVSPPTGIQASCRDLLAAPCRFEWRTPLCRTTSWTANTD